MLGYFALVLQLFSEPTELIHIYEEQTFTEKVNNGGIKLDHRDLDNKKK